MSDAIEFQAFLIVGQLSEGAVVKPLLKLCISLLSSFLKTAEQTWQDVFQIQLTSLHSWFPPFFQHSLVPPLAFDHFQHHPLTEYPVTSVCLRLSPLYGHRCTVLY